MIAAAQSSDTLTGPLYVYMIGTIELFQRNFCLTCQRNPSDFYAAGNFLPDDFVQLLKMQLFLPQSDGFHPAADIHSHHIGDDTILNGHGCTDGAALACMDIRHNADGAFPEGLQITEPLNLFRRFRFQRFTVTPGRVADSLNFYHNKSLLSPPQPIAAAVFFVFFMMFDGSAAPSAGKERLRFRQD